VVNVYISNDAGPAPQQPVDASAPPVDATMPVDASMPVDANVGVDAAPSGPGIGVDGAYEVNEGSTLDLVLDSTTPGATITTSPLPQNATLQNNILTFAPSDSQAGLYPITLTVAAGGAVTTKQIAVRVWNVIHIAEPTVQSIDEGAQSTPLTFTSDDPAGTVVTYWADVSSVPGATFDPTTAKLTFAPTWRWLDSQPAQVDIIVNATGTEIDSGIVRTSSVHALYAVTEATSFSQELVPFFLLPIGSTGGAHPEWESREAHNCMSSGCHDGTGTAGGGLDFHPTSIYGQLVNHAIAQDNINGSTCHSLAAQGVMEVTPGDLTKSLWFMKISGTDGAGNVGPPCGVQMSQGQPFNWLTVTDEDAWLACAPTDMNCRADLDCNATDVTCKLSARLVRKASVWIMAGAPNN
jgi:hypothetical protein